MSSCDFYYLQPGLMVPAPAGDAVLNLERAGHRLVIDATGEHIEIEAANGVAIDPHDLDQLRRWKYHALLFMSYQPSDEHLQRLMQGESEMAAC